MRTTWKGACATCLPNTHLYRKAIRICDLECNVRAKKTSKTDTMKQMSIYIYKSQWTLTVSTNNDKIYVPPSCDLYAPRDGTILYIYIYYAGTGSCVHEPIHHIFRSFVGQHRKMGCCPPAISRFYICTDGTHTQLAQSLLTQECGRQLSKTKYRGFHKLGYSQIIHFPLLKPSSYRGAPRFRKPPYHCSS